MILRTACASNIGIVRAVNQDAIMVQTVKKGHQMAAVGVVCDGIGGLDRGELASNFLIDELTSWTNQLPQKVNLANADSQIVYAHFQDEVEIINEKLCDFIRKEKINTGSTLSAILVIKDHYYVIQVGDSRIYHFNQFLEQITDDEIRYVDKDGCIKKKLTNYMGKQSDLQFLTYQGMVVAGDSFLFCSDGFYHHLLASDLERLFKSEMNESGIKKELERLIARMIQRGERDNISVGVIRCQARKSFFQKRKIRRSGK